MLYACISAVYKNRGCSSLTSVTIPNSVTSIGDFAFSYCSNLENLYCYAEKISYLGRYIFDGSYIEVGSLSEIFAYISRLTTLHFSLSQNFSRFRKQPLHPFFFWIIFAPSEPPKGFRRCSLTCCYTKNKGKGIPLIHLLYINLIFHH